MMKNFLKNKKGISLPEVILAIAIFSMVATAIMMLVVDTYDLSFFSSQRNQAREIAKQGMEAVESISRSTWTDLQELEDDEYYGLSDNDGSYWSLVPNSSDLVNAYTRTIKIEDVFRDENGDIISEDEEGSEEDIQTKKVTVRVTWLESGSSEKEFYLEKYLTIWDSEQWEESEDLEFASGSHSATVVSDNGQDYLQLQGYPASKAEGIVGLWGFDENGGEAIIDGSGNDNDGTINGGATRSEDEYKYKSLDFDGTDDYVEVSESDSLKPSEFLTVSAWVNLDSLGSKYYLIDNSGGFDLGVNSDGTAFFNVNSNPVDSSSILATGSWYYLVGAYNGNKLRLYINGELSGETELEETVDYSGNVFIGANSELSNHLDGQLDEVIVYNRPLTSSEIKTNYEEGVLTSRVSLNFDESDDKAATDNSGYDNNGSLENYDSSVKMEVGLVEGVTDDWPADDPTENQYVEFENIYESPVIIAQMYEKDNEESPASVRIDYNEGDDFFKLKLDYPLDSHDDSSSGGAYTDDGIDFIGDGDDYLAVADDVYYIVMEEGPGQLADGTKIEAHTFTTNQLNYKADWGLYNIEEYENAYTSSPLVLHQIQTAENTEWLTTWTSSSYSKSKPPEADAVNIGLNGAENTTSLSAAAEETIGWIAIESDVVGSFMNADESATIYYETQLTGKTITGHWIDNASKTDNCLSYEYYNKDYYDPANPPLAISSQLTMIGGDGGWSMVCDNEDGENLGLHVEEDQSESYNDRAHAAEYGGFIAFSEAFNTESNNDVSWSEGRFGNSLNFGGANEYVLVENKDGNLKMEASLVEDLSDEWETVTLDNEYFNPVVVAQMYENYNEESPASVRIKDVTTNSFQIKLDYPFDISDDGSFGFTDYYAVADDVYYMVIEEGVWELPDGNNTKIEAHTFTTSTINSKSNGWAFNDALEYENVYISDPAVLHQIQTAENDEWITTWATSLTHKGTPPNNSELQIGLNGAQSVNSFAESKAETIGWVAIENDAAGYKTGSFTDNNEVDIYYEVQDTGKNVKGHDNSCYNYVYQNTYTDIPLLITSQATMAGGDGGWSIVCDNDVTTGIGVHIEEDQTVDAERDHGATEHVSFLAFSESFSLDESEEPSNLFFDEEMAVSAWIYREDDMGTWEVIASKGDDIDDGTDFVLAINSDDELSFKVSDTEVISNQVINTEEWYFVNAVYDGENLIIYINGEEDDSTAYTDNINLSTNHIYISDEDYTFSGLIDEVEIYDQALSSEQVQGQFQKAFELVGQWHMNEASWLDTSGLENSGTGSGGVSFNSSGKFGGSADFDGSGEITVADDYSLNWPIEGSIEAWFKPDSTTGTQYLLSKDDGSTGFNVYLEDGYLYFNLNDYTISSSEVLTADGNWYYFVGIFSEDQDMKMYLNGEIQDNDAQDYRGNWRENTADLDIGTSFSGTIDEVVIWNRILSAEEIASNYNGELVYWGHFNDNTGSYAYDSSAYGYYENFTGADWASGKFGAALEFDGTGSVSISNNTNLDITDEVTYSAWVKPANDFTGRGNIIYNGSSNRSLQVDGDNNNFVFNLEIDGGDVYSLSSEAISSWNSWHQVTGTFDGYNMRLYVDGFEVGSEEISDDEAVAIISKSDSDYIGSDFSGKLDEVKIYNKGLSSEEAFNNYVLDLYSGYALEGTFTSQNKDLTKPSTFNTIYWEDFSSASHAVKIQLRSALSDGSIDDSSWHGESGVDVYFENSEEDLLSLYGTDHNGHQQVQYKTVLSGDGSSTPRFDLFRLNYSQ